jgi:hypothetical protein
MKTLSELRKVCKSHGIKVKKETLSWGAHLTFIIDGRSISGCSPYSPDFLERNKPALDMLATIRDDFAGMKIDDEKVYGI